MEPLMGVHIESIEDTLCLTMPDKDLATIFISNQDTNSDLALGRIGIGRCTPQGVSDLLLTWNISFRLGNEGKNDTLVFFAAIAGAS